MPRFNDFGRKCIVCGRSCGKPVLLDLFAGGGGAARGYQRAGFCVLGVDIQPQPRYAGCRFEQWDALALETWWLADFNVIHASPPCQPYSTTRTLHDGQYPKLISNVRDLLISSGLPYVIENVVGAPLLNPVKLCGSSFGLPIRRHRLFESLLPLMSLPCAHTPDPIDVTGGGPSKRKRLDGAGGRSRKPKNVAEAGAALGIDWMTRDELNEAVPPAFTHFIGDQLIQHLNRVPA